MTPGIAPRLPQPDEVMAPTKEPTPPVAAAGDSSRWTSMMKGTVNPEPEADDVPAETAEPDEPNPASVET